MSQIPKTCTEAETLLGAYVIGATTHEESLAIEALLAECPQLVDELSNYMLVREQLSMMASSTAPTPFPPADLVESPWLDMSSHLREMGEDVTEESRTTTLKKLQPVTPPTMQDNSHQRVFPVAIWYAFGSIAASIILVVGIVVTAERLLNQLDQDRAVLATLINDYQNDISRIQPTRDQFSGLQTADHIELSPTFSEVDDGQARVIWDAQSSVGVLIITNMPDLDSNQRYQMWLVKDDMETSVGVFQVDATGSGNLIFHLSEPLESFEIIGISVEPEGGSPTPTTPHLVIGEIDL